MDNPNLIPLGAKQGPSNAMGSEADRPVGGSTGNLRENRIPRPIGNSQQGVPNWLAQPIIVSDTATLPIDSPELLLMNKMQKPCKSMGVDSLFAGIYNCQYR